MIDQAVEIYNHKILFQESKGSNHESIRSKGSSRRECICLAKRFGVTERAIKDIWNRRSWAFATSHLWAHEGELENEGINQKMTAAQVFSGLY